MKALIRLLGYILLSSVQVACATHGKPGTPLPPQNKEIGKKWPPEVRQFIDGMLTVFVDGKPAPSPAEIETVFGVKAVPHGDAESNKNYGLSNQYELQGWQLKDPTVQHGTASYEILLPRDGKQSYWGEFNIDTRRYCIDPYDFAVYTGKEFSVWDTPPDDAPWARLPEAYYRSSYQWGMFDWSPDGKYESERLKLWLSKDRRCIAAFEPRSYFVLPAKNGANQ